MGRLPKVVADSWETRHHMDILELCHHTSRTETEKQLGTFLNSVITLPELKQRNSWEHSPVFYHYSARTETEKQLGTLLRTDILEICHHTSRIETEKQLETQSQHSARTETDNSWEHSYIFSSLCLN